MGKRSKMNTRVKCGINKIGVSAKVEWGYPGPNATRRTSAWRVLGQLPAASRATALWGPDKRAEREKVQESWTIRLGIFIRLFACLMYQKPSVCTRQCKLDVCWFRSAVPAQCRHFLAFYGPLGMIESNQVNESNRLDAYHLQYSSKKLLTLFKNWVSIKPHG